MNFIDRLKELTGERGVVARLAEGTNISDSLLSKYKRGLAEPSLTNAVLIADFFDVSLDWLAGREGYERDAHKRAGPSPALTSDEAGLVDSYRLMDTEQRGRYRDMAGTFVMASEKDGAGAVVHVGGARVDMTAKSPMRGDGAA